MLRLPPPATQFKAPMVALADCRSAANFRGVLMLIDTRGRPDPEPAPEPIEIDWRLAFWICCCLVLFVAASWAPSLLGVPLAMAGVYATFKILVVATGGWGTGLHDWRQ